MKKLVILIASLVASLVASMTAVSAMGGELSRNNSWSEIFASGASTFQDYNLGGIALSNACLTDTQVKSIAPQRVCTHWSQVETTVSSSESGIKTIQNVCDSYGLVNVASPRAYTKTVCDQYGATPDSIGEGNFACLHESNVTVMIPNTIQVGVYMNVQGEPAAARSDAFPGFTKGFTFPACR